MTAPASATSTPRKRPTSGRSSRASSTSTHGGKRFNVIDTPGYADFIGQTIGALRGVDTAVIVINAHSGIEVNTRRVFKEAEQGRRRADDRHQQDGRAQHRLSRARSSGFATRSATQCVLLNVPIGHGGRLQRRGQHARSRRPTPPGRWSIPSEIHTPLIESIIEVDEELMTKYFEGEEPSHEQLDALIVQAVAKGTLIPIVCCSAKTGVGLTELLDALVAVRPAADGRRRARRTKDGAEVEIKADPGRPAGGPGLQDPHRPVRAEAELHPRLSAAR